MNNPRLRQGQARGSSEPGTDPAHAPALMAPRTGLGRTQRQPPSHGRSCSTRKGRIVRFQATSPRQSSTPAGTSPNSLACLVSMETCPALTTGRANCGPARPHRAPDPAAIQESPTSSATRPTPPTLRRSARRWAGRTCGSCR